MTALFPRFSVSRKAMTVIARLPWRGIEIPVFISFTLNTESLRKETVRKVPRGDDNQKKNGPEGI
jgi:hypothetical protein